MEIYILRHGQAVASGRGEVDRDAARPLTEAGREEVLGVAGGLGRLGVGLDLLLTSPLLRARQTAELVAETLSVARGPEECAALVPEGEPEAALAAALAALGQAERLMLVGHMPLLGELAAWLAWAEPGMSLPLRTGGLCRVDLPAGSGAGAGDLRWLLPPRLARRLA